MKKIEANYENMIWYKIRYYQKIYNITDKQLADCFSVSERTLRNYDKNPRNLTIGMISSFLELFDLDFDLFFQSEGLYNRKRG